jgi:hypothetical protein
MRERMAPPIEESVASQDLLFNEEAPKQLADTLNAAKAGRAQQRDR